MKFLSRQLNQPQDKKNVQSADKSGVLDAVDKPQLMKTNKKGSKEEAMDTGLGLFFI